jgi:hypothetical protein
VVAALFRGHSSLGATMTSGRTVPDTAAIIAAAVRLLRAWGAATQGIEPLSLKNPAVAEVHEATRELIRATGTTDLLAAYTVLDDLVAQIKLAQ